MQEKKILLKGKKAAIDAVQLCLEKGFLKENLIEKLQTQVFSGVANIIQEGQDGLYDAVAHGRSGTQKSLLVSLFKGPVCSVQGASRCSPVDVSLTGKALIWSKPIMPAEITIRISNHALEPLNMYRFLTSNISDSETTLNPNFS
ncbi:MAG: hypothetical protein KKE61_05785 [Proteobacteria bacterium]|nr:hypothetical protein [Pseudomonadota bacterium]